MTAVQTNIGKATGIAVFKAMIALFQPFF